MVRTAALSLVVVLAAGSTAAAQEKIDFATQIQPIFAAKCAGCHGEEKASAKLRLHTADAISAFEKKDKLLVAGKPDESELYKRIVLPADDKKRMPKKGDPLPEAEVGLIKQWIEQGAVLAAAAAVTAPPADAAKMAEEEAAKKAKEAEEAAKKADEEALAKVTAASPEAIKKITDAGATVMPLFAESPLLQVSFARAASPAGDDALASLAGAAEQIVWLDLSTAQASAKGWAELAKLKNLNRLHLEKSSIDDAGLANLSALPRLEYLNLYGTGITDAGLEHLKPIKRLRKLYLWQTKVGYDPAMALQAATPGLEVNLGWDHPGVVKVRLTKEIETAKKTAEEATAKAAEAQKQLEAANAEKTAAEAKVAELDKQLKELEPKAADAPAEQPAAAPAEGAAPAAEAK
jgi:mono/diheme cytochrome c family protein